MIHRLTSNTNNSFPAVQYTGERSLKDVLPFCKFCFYLADSLFMNYKGAAIKVKKLDWIVKVSDEVFLLIGNTYKQKIFTEPTENEQSNG